MGLTIDIHPSEELLEMYAMRLLPHSAATELRRHSAVCQECRHWLAGWALYVRAIRLALIRTAASAPDFRHTELDRWRVPREKVVTIPNGERRDDGV